MFNWHSLKDVKELRGFFGLIGYYKSFVKGYAKIVEALAQLLKKYAFKWSKEAQMAFDTFKQVLSSFLA